MSSLAAGRLGATVAGCWSRRPAGAAAALTVFVVLLLLAGRYGPHGDELYFRMLPLDWWYVDQPPLTVWLSRAAASISDAFWVQRVPAALAAAGGALLTAAFPRVLGYGSQVQSVAAWAHASTVYPLIVGHVFLTSSLDLLAWQGIVLLVVMAARGRVWSLAWAGAVAGIACWNKLLIIPLLGALVISLLIMRRDLLFSRAGAVGAAVATLVGGPQVLAQAMHGWPMRAVSGDLVAANAGVNRWLVLPLLVAFVGPPLFGVCLRGLRWSTYPSPIGLLAPAAIVLVGWNLVAPAQPYYAVGLFLCALAIGWGPVSEGAGVIWRHARSVIAANAVIGAVIALPVLPVPSAVHGVVAAVNPVARDQVGWADWVAQADRARGGTPAAVVTDAYALAGAIHFYGSSAGEPIEVASGHNALWDLGPPAAEQVLLVGPRAVARSADFTECRAAGRLSDLHRDSFGVAGSPMLWCSGPIGGWAAIWPAFRHLGA